MTEPAAERDLTTAELLRDVAAKSEAGTPPAGFPELLRHVADRIEAIAAETRTRIAPRDFELTRLRAIAALDGDAPTPGALADRVLAAIWPERA